MRKTFEIPLDIPEVTIQHVETDRHGDFVITVKSTVEGTSCHKCGKKITKVYGDDREITLRHLPILGRKTYIRLRPVRYQCPYCRVSKSGRLGSILLPGIWPSCTSYHRLSQHCARF